MNKQITSKLAAIKQEVVANKANNLCVYCKAVIEGDTEFCSRTCQNFSKCEDKIKLALNRIRLDQALYSGYNHTLRKILLKVWTYTEGHEYEEEMRNRLMEELEEMSGTCSSGFASRLINVISGFGEFSIRISWEEQIIGNFTGRLNAAARRISDESSIFRRSPYLEEMIALWLNSDGYALAELRDTLGERATMEDVVSAFLETDRAEKTEECLEDLSDRTLLEMALSTVQSAERQHFALFFRSHVAAIREEMYSEFKEHLDDTSFDLYMRKAVMHYEGVIAA